MEAVGKKDPTKPFPQPPSKDTTHCTRAFHPINSGELQYKPTSSLTDQKFQGSDFQCKKGKCFLNKSCRKQCHFATKLTREQGRLKQNVNTMIFRDPHFPCALKHRILSNSYELDKSKEADHTTCHVWKTEKESDLIHRFFPLMSCQVNLSR